MNTHRMAALAGVVAAGLLVVGCSQGSGPIGPSIIPANVGGAFELRGSVSAGGPLEGVLATVSNGQAEYSTVTDSGGEFGFSGLSAGTWHVSLTKEGFSDETRDVEVNGDTTISSELRPAQAPMVTMPRTCSTRSTSLCPSRIR